MPSNIEIKAKAQDLQHKHHLAQAVADHGPELLHQHDTFFTCAHGRLKLRQFSADHGELIAYSRPDQADAKRSDYLITPTTAPALLRETLANALGVVQVVEKTRHLYLAGQTRIHLDEVAGLGTFIELEVVLREGQSQEEASDRASVNAGTGDQGGRFDPGRVCGYAAMTVPDVPGKLPTTANVLHHPLPCHGRDRKHDPTHQ